MQHSLQKNAHIYIPTPICIRIHMHTNTHAHALHRPHAEALNRDLQSMHKYSYTYTFDWCCFYYFLRNSLVALLEALFALHLCINAYIYIYIHTCTYIYIYMSAHIHTYTYIHTRIQNVHMNARKARLKRRRGSDCARSPTWHQEALPFSLSAAIRRGIPFVASSPIACPRGTMDKRRTTTTNSSSSHHHDSAPSRPHLLICTGAEPIHPVHGPLKLPAWPWPPETRSFFCHFGGISHWLGQFGYYSEREEESAEFKNMYSPRSSPPLMGTDRWCLTPTPRVTWACACLSSMCLRSVRVPCWHSPPLLRLQLVDSVLSWKVCACDCLPGKEMWCVGVRSGVRSWVTGGRVQVWGRRLWLGGRCECSFVGWKGGRGHW